MCVDQTLLCQEGGGLKPQHCSIANHILTAYLWFKDLLSQIPHCVLNYKLDRLTSPSLVYTSVSLVTFHYKRWPVRSVYWENTWSLERAVCPSSFEREQGLILLETYFTFPKTGLWAQIGCILPVDSREGWLSDWISGCCLLGYTKWWVKERKNEAIRFPLLVSSLKPLCNYS